ncbi:MAG: DoxX family protein [Sciscionella sp.]
MFFLVAAAGPKLAGQQYAVEMFNQMGAGQWFRYLVGALELAGAIGLLIPRLAGLAALGLIGVMVGAVLTQVFVFGSGVMALTPALLGVVFGLVAWGRWPQTKALAGKLKR